LISPPFHRKRSFYGNHRTSADLSARTWARSAWFAILHLLRGSAHRPGFIGASIRTACELDARRRAAAGKWRMASCEYRASAGNASTSGPNTRRASMAIRAVNSSPAAAMAARARGTRSASLVRPHSGAVVYAGRTGRVKPASTLQNVP